MLAATTLSYAHGEALKRSAYAAIWYSACECAPLRSWQSSGMATLVLLFAAVAFAGAVLLVTYLIVGRWLPERLRRWAWAPVGAMLALLPFADEAYNEHQTRIACEQQGGLVVRKTIVAPSVQAGMALIETVRLDSEADYFWKRELLFRYRPNGEELARLRWFERKGGWLRGNEPGTRLTRFMQPGACPDPQNLLAQGAARVRLVRVAGTS
jgi:hypothetical protein